MGREEFCQLLTIFCVGAILFFAGGCMQKADGITKLRDLDYKIVTAEQAGEELVQMIEEKKALPFRFTYQEEGTLYICIGYGKKPSGGYSITVEELMEADNAIYVDTNLLGPSPEDSEVKGTSYPLLIIRTRDLDKCVVFQ